LEEQLSPVKLVVSKYTAPVALVLDPAVSPTAMAVLSLISLTALLLTKLAQDTLIDAIINILLDADDGVMLTDNPVISANVDDEEDAVSVFVALTTCNTLPAGN
jgi:hypothetical protein